MNYYAVLGIRSDAEPDAIRRAFRALVRRYHPDVGEGSSAERFREIVAAYETLNDPVRRREYDRSLRLDHPTRPRFVEPITPRPPAEPLLDRGPRLRSQPYVVASLRLDEIFEQLFGSWDELFFSDAARRRM